MLLVTAAVLVATWVLGLVYNIGGHWLSIVTPLLAVVYVSAHFINGGKAI